jgi:3-oxoacyl-[acyl-carrier-protein] synthase II
VKKRVVITGLGALTAAGEGTGRLWEAVRHGQPAKTSADFGVEGIVAARIPDFVPEKFIHQRKSLKVMARDIQLAVAAAKLALEDSGLDLSGFNHERFGVIAGSGVLNHELEELAASVKSSLTDTGALDLKKFGEEGMGSLFPLWLLKYLPNMPACHISILFNLQGPNNTITTGPSAGLQAVGEAFRIIQRGGADQMLAGGAESKVNPVGLSQYQILGVLSNDYRPFDVQSTGFIPGEGAGFLVLEEWEHAKKRGASIYAEIIGFGASSKAGQKNAIKGALAEAEIPASKVHYVQATGLGLKEEDVLEIQAMESVWGEYAKDLWVAASKPLMGFTGFAAGALDLIISTLALEEQMAPGAVCLERPRSDWKFQWAKGAPRKMKLDCAMTNTFGFGGQCVSMVTRKAG